MNVPVGAVEGGPGDPWGRWDPVKTALVAASLMGASMVGVRLVTTHKISFTFMLWNLFLAWVPLALTPGLVRAIQAGAVGRMAVLMGSWLLFLPNAPYMVTDLVHWRPKSGVFSWFDGLMLVHFAWLGVALGCHALRDVHRAVADRRGHAAGWVFAMVVTGLCGYGVYLGRFERWNSWDVFCQPVHIFRDVASHLLHPVESRRVWGFTGVCGIFLMSVYLTSFVGSRSSLPR